MTKIRRRITHINTIVSLILVLACPSVVLSQQDNNLIYHIFVRSFADTPSDSVAANTGGEIGDLKGLQETFNYLNDGDPHTDHDLEVGILWVMPVFPSQSYHGYDVTDYKNIHPDYGTLQDLKALIQLAHQRGVRIILDLPVNHTGSEHPWFKEAVEDPSSPFRKFYHFRDADQPSPPGTWHMATSSTGKKIRYLGLFSPNMPDLNFEEPAVHQEIKNIAQFWLDQGVDGFRLDAAKHIFGDTFQQIPEPDILRNNDWWRAFSDHVYRINPQAILVGEVLGDREMLRRHAFGNDGLLDEPFMHAAREAIAFPHANLLTEWKNFVDACRNVNRLAHLGPGAGSRTEPFQAFLFLASHDANPRLTSHLEQMKQHGMQASVDEAYRVGMYLLLSLGKYPILYNGDELMQRGFKWNGNSPTGDPPGDGSGIFDETLREPFPWHQAAIDAPQTAWFAPRFDEPNDGISVEEQEGSGTMLHLVRGLTNLRSQHSGFANGELGAILTDTAEWMVFEKLSETARYLVLINPTVHGKDYHFHQGWFPRYIQAQLLFWSDGKGKEWKNETATNEHIESKVFVPPYGLVVLRERSN